MKAPYEQSGITLLLEPEKVFQLSQWDYYKEFLKGFVFKHKAHEADGGIKEMDYGYYDNGTLYFIELSEFPAVKSDGSAGKSLTNKRDRKAEYDEIHEKTFLPLAIGSIDMLLNGLAGWQGGNIEKLSLIFIYRFDRKEDSLLLSKLETAIVREFWKRIGKFGIRSKVEFMIYDATNAERHLPHFFSPD